MNRLITTFDEVPPLSTEVDVLPAIHIAGNDGVSFETCTAEVFRPVPTRKAEAFQERDPQGLRRPRFSFFIFTCQTARDRWDPTLPLLEGSRKPHPTTNNNRLLSAVESLIVMRSLRGAKRCVGLGGQCIAALSGRVIGPPDRGCQRPSSTNCRIRSKKFATQRSPYIWGLWPH